MKKLILTIVIVLSATVTFANNNDKIVAVIVYDKYKNFSEQQGAYIKTIINGILTNNPNYTTVNRDQNDVDMIVEEQFKQNADFIYDRAARVKVGNLLGANYLVIVNVLKPEGKYSVSCELMNVSTGQIEKSVAEQCKPEYKSILDLYAQLASSFLAENPKKFKDDVQKEIRRKRKEIDDIIEEEPGAFGVKNNRVKFGIGGDYVLRSYEVKDIASGHTENGTPWDTSHINGVQAGLRFDTYFAPKKLGLGVSFGLYGGYYFYDGSTLNSQVSFQEAVLTIPAQAIYRFDINNKIGIYARFGVSADFSLYSRLNTTVDGTSITMNKLYDNSEWNYSRMFNWNVVYGAGIQIHRIILEVSQSRGMTDLSKSKEIRIRQNRNIQVGLTFMF